MKNPKQILLADHVPSWLIKNVQIAAIAVVCLFVGLNHSLKVKVSNGINNHSSGLSIGR